MAMRRRLWIPLAFGVVLSCKNSDSVLTQRVVEVPTAAVAGQTSVTVTLHEFGMNADGEPMVLIFLHGVGGSQETWEELGGVPHEFAIRPGDHGNAYYRTVPLSLHARCAAAR
jgi:pimeloyl-ACP methyl ester carboxylesterase